MRAVDTIETLLKTGVLVKEAFAKAKSAGSARDWAGFVKSPHFTELAKDVRDSLGQVSASDIREAITAINEKKKALLAGRRVAELPPETLLQYSALLDAETALVNREIENVGVTPHFLEALAQALPALLAVAKIVLPLLL